MKKHLSSPILYVGEEPAGRHVPKLKLALAELMRSSVGTGHRRRLNKPYLEIRADGCWVWLRSKNLVGYGQCVLDGKKIIAHRFFFGFIKEPLIPGLTLDHLCYTRACCNPDHLEQVTHIENKRRAREHWNLKHPDKPWGYWKRKCRS